MELDELLRPSGEFPVDEIVGQIVKIDWVKERTSQFGPNQLVQDVVLQTPDQRKFVIAFYDLNVRCFTKQVADSDTPMHFQDQHMNCWIRVRNSAKDDSKPTLRRLSKRDKSVVHWAKFGAQAVLKATGTVDAHWLLEDGADQPWMGPTEKIRRLQKLRVPGQEPEKPKSAPPPPPETTAAAEPTNQEKYGMSSPESLTRAMAHAGLISLKAIIAAYDKSEDITMPKGDQLVATVSTIMIALKDKLNLLRDEEGHIKACAWFLAQMYVDQHRQVLRELENTNEIRDERLMSLVTTCFIQSSREVRLPSKKRGGDRR